MDNLYPGALARQITHHRTRIRFEQLHRVVERRFKSSKYISMEKGHEDVFQIKLKRLHDGKELDFDDHFRWIFVPDSYLEKFRGQMLGAELGL